MKYLAQLGNVTNPFKTINNSSPLANSTNGSGLFILLNVLIKTAIIGAALYTLINFLMAGYMFLSAGGDSKAVQKAWEKIYLSVIGLLVTAGAFILAAVFGLIIFGDASILITPRVFSPK